MEYKLIAIDMDGTLLNSKNMITERTINAIEKAEEKGVQIVLSTGRLLSSARYFSDKLGLKNPVLACNGAIIIDKNREIIYSKSLEKQVANKVMDLGKKYNVYFHFYNEECLFTNQYVKEVVDYYSDKDQKIDIRIYNKDSEILEDKNLNIYKFLFIDNDFEKLAKLKEELLSVDRINISKSWENNLEVMDLEASKGLGLEYICNGLSISRDQVIAIGDSDNDLSMINFAGLGVSMGNGNEMVRNNADYITSTNDEDGVAKVIEKFIL